MDLNVVIDYLGNLLPVKTTTFIDSLPVVISIITCIEIVGWYNATNHEIEKLKSFADKAFIYMLNEDVISETINYGKNIKLNFRMVLLQLLLLLTILP